MSKAMPLFTVLHKMLMLGECIAAQCSFYQFLSPPDVCTDPYLSSYPFLFDSYIILYCIYI